jgi:tetratricopeptide (TPR) repeat protein
MADADDRKPRGKRRGAPAPQIPDSNVAVEIAMEAIDHEGGDVEVARDLLVRQSRLVTWQIRTEQLRFATKVAVGIVAAVVAIVAASMIIAALRSHEVIVQAFETPPSLAGRGINGKVVASSVQDALADIQQATRSIAQKRDISNEWTTDINVEVPQTGVSIGEIDRLLRQRLGRNTYVGGDLVQSPTGDLSLTVRAAGIRARTFTGPAGKLSDLARQAAEYVYGRAEPRLFASYLNQNDRYQDTIDFVSEVYSHAPDDQRPFLANSKGNALSSLNRNTEALDQYQLAVQLDPYRWQIWGNIVGVGMQTYGEGYAYAQAIKMRRAIAAAPADKKPKAADQINVNLLFQEWTDSSNEQQLNAKLTGGGDATTSNNAIIADNEVRRHDWAIANRYISAGDRSDPTTEPTRNFINGYRELDAGRPDVAVPFFRKLDEEMHKSADVTFNYMDGSCWLGLALGLSGQSAEADAVFKRAGRWVSCLTFQADVLEAQGKRAEADAAYARATAWVPGMPFAYQHWGQALLARGNLRDAAAKFHQAQQRGPRWAEPYEGLGEVYLRAHFWTEAEQQFAKASEFAPHWSRLNRLWAIALYRLGRTGDAQAKLNLAKSDEPVDAQH